VVIITVASGKGGTGKTTVATSLALANNTSASCFIDCDVEAPDAHLFLKPRFDVRQDINMLIPQVDEERCDGCERCAEVCQYHAIVVLGGAPLVFPELCHGCGSCALNCPQGAIHEVPRVLGIQESGLARGNIHFTHGKLNIGEPMAVPIIRQLKRWEAAQNAETVIRDAPPGTSCPVVESIRGADFVLLVTEPTPFGLHDLKLATQLVRELRLPAGVIINRDCIGDTNIDEYCIEASLPVLMSIPMARSFAKELAEGEALVDAFPEYLPRFRCLYRRILNIVYACEGTAL
jgi:MinD superfamily P-loop ATPase